MDTSVSPGIQKWIRKCLKEEFEEVVEKALAENEETSDIAQQIINSKEMSILLNSMKIAITERYSGSKSVSNLTEESRPQSSFSFASDVTLDDWNASKTNDDQYNCIIDKISCDKPVHVRLAGYEILQKTDLSNLGNNPMWNTLQKTLMDGLIDESRPVFEASLQIHAKLLVSQQSHNAYTNLLNAFNAQFYSQNTFEVLPTYISGINFKFFLHEKLFRIMHLIIRYQEETLKGVRIVDKTVEEIIEQFMVFLSTHEFGDGTQPKKLNVLNTISVLEPRADWCKKWIANLATRRIFLSTLAKSPNLLQHILQYVQKGLLEPPYSVTVSISDEPVEVCINGNTIDTVTYLHCLCFVSQLCAYQTGRTLLSESIQEDFSVSDFLIASLGALKKLCSELSSSVYDTSCYALQSILEKPKVTYDSKFYHDALCDLLSLPESDIKIWPHTLLIISHMLDTADGSVFLISHCKDHTPSENSVLKCPATILLISAVNILKQPLSILNTEYLLNLFKVVEMLFDIHDAYEVVQDIVEKEFYPAVSYFYTKLDKCFFVNESKGQQINSAVKRLLLKIVSIPFGLYALVQVKTVFEELIRGSIAPLRATWIPIEVLSFVSQAACFQLGYNVLAELAPHVLSTLLSETCKALEDTELFYDPWDNDNVSKFLHILSFFSLNFKCFAAFMTTDKESRNCEEEHALFNLAELFLQSVNPESEYHYLGLLSLDIVMWNLNVSMYLMEVLDFQNRLLELQNPDDIATETEDGSNKEVIIDEYRLLRSKILCRLYFIKNEEEEDNSKSEDYYLPLLPPPKLSKEDMPISSFVPDSELSNLLQESNSGLLDSNWVLQVRSAYKESSDSINNAVMVQLVDQMQKAIPTAEWIENFQWQENVLRDTGCWFSEEIHGINLALYYAEQSGIKQDVVEVKERLQQFINESYVFIQYERPKQFEQFDWFLSTIFIICDADINKCKTFVTQLIQFPSTIFLWPVLGKVIERTNNEECNMQFIFMQCVESIVSNELPTVKYALKSTCGISWAMMCNVLLSQCFWGTLPWEQIMNFFAICILYPPDYMVYYCVSLLYHCQSKLMQNVTNGKLWPEHMSLDDYQCQRYITYMDTLGKRYGNRILPKMTVKETDTVIDT